jgi:hypothetical protein
MLINQPLPSGPKSGQDNNVFHPTARTIALGIFTIIVVPTALTMMKVEPWLIIGASLFAAAIILIIGHRRAPTNWRINAMPITLMIIGTALFIGGAVWYHQIHRTAVVSPAGDANAQAGVPKVQVAPIASPIGSKSAVATTVTAPSAANIVPTVVSIPQTSASVSVPASQPITPFPSLSLVRQSQITEQLRQFGGQLYGLGVADDSSAEAFRLVLMKILGDANWVRHEPGGPEKTSDQQATLFHTRVEGIGLYLPPDSDEKQRMAADTLAKALRTDDITVEFCHSDLMKSASGDIEINIGARMWKSPNVRVKISHGVEVGVETGQAAGLAMTIHRGQSPSNPNAPPDRVVTSALEAELMNRIPESKQIVVGADLGDNEAYDYAMAIWRFLKEKGYNAGDGVIQYTTLLGQPISISWGENAPEAPVQITVGHNE